MRALVLALMLLAPLAAAAPEQVHVGLPSGDPAHEVSVLWVDLQAGTAPQKVVLDTPEGKKEFPATQVTGPGLGVTQEAKLTGLAPNTTYTYHVGDRAFQLTTAPAGPANFSFVALGDMGVAPEAAASVKAIQELNPNLVIHGGDISYAEGRQNEWIEWFGMVEPLAATRPWVTALGNHETYTGSSVTDVTTFAGEDKRLPSPVEIAFYHERFGLPGNELWYSFDWGGVHFVALDTFSEAAIPAAETAWLTQDLAAHANATWTVAFLHEPPYSTGTSHGSSARVQHAFVPLLEAGGVDLVIAGHEHNYERSYPLRAGVPLATTNDTQEGNGTVYVVTGGGGEALYPFGEKAAPWSAARSSTHHVLAVSVTPDAIEGRYVGTDGKPFADAFRIHKAPAPLILPAAEEAKPAPALGVAVLFAVLVCLAWARARRG